MFVGRLSNIFPPSFQEINDDARNLVTWSQVTRMLDDHEAGQKIIGMEDDDDDEDGLSDGEDAAPVAAAGAAAPGVSSPSSSSPSKVDVFRGHLFSKRLNYTGRHCTLVAQLTTFCDLDFDVVLPAGSCLGRYESGRIGLEGGKQSGTPNQQQQSTKCSLRPPCMSHPIYHN